MRLLTCGPGIVHELRKRVINLGEILINRLPSDVVHVAHFDFESHACQWCTKIVGDARQHQGPIGIRLMNLACHAIKATVEGTYFTRARFRQCRGRSALGDQVRRARQTRQRTVDIRHPKGCPDE